LTTYMKQMHAVIHSTHNTSDHSSFSELPQQAPKTTTDGVHLQSIYGIDYCSTFSILSFSFPSRFRCIIIHLQSKSSNIGTISSNCIYAL
jgi:hypothetical protein